MYLNILLFPCIGITIHKTLDKINKDNLLSKIKSDLQRRKNLKMPLQRRISTVKMNVLLCLNFHSMISNFIWDRTRISLSALQWPKLLSGLLISNFKLYYWSFQIGALSTWTDPKSTTAWERIELTKVVPHRLQDIPFSNVTNKPIINNSGPII